MFERKQDKIARVLGLVVFFCVALIYSGSVFAQKKEQNFEEKHQDKEAIFLEYSSTIKVNEDWSFRKEDYKKLKILKEDAKSMGEIPVPYDKENDKIVEISAYTITPDGKRHKYTKTTDISLYPSYPIYSNMMVKIITMPEVNVGSVLEYKVIIESKGMQIRNAFWKDFYFMPNLPIKLMKQAVILPKKLNIQYKEFNLTYKPKITQGNAAITYAWEIHDAYDDRKPEEYLRPPQIGDVPEVVEFSSIKTWKDVSDWYYALIQKNLKITPDIEVATKKAISGKVAIKDKVRAILEYVQDNFRYVSMSLGEYSLEPHPTDEVFKNKYGDCKDLSLLCVAMFKVAGIESNVALFKDEYSITDPQHDLPIPTLFDHVIVLVDDGKEKSFYVDPQLKGYDIGEYPLYYQNAYTFVITQDGGKFGRLPIFAEERSYTKQDIKTVINPDGSVLSEMTSLWPLDSSIETREQMKSLDNTEKEDFYQRLNAMLAAGGEVLERRWENFDNRYGRIKSYVKVRRRDAYLVSDGMIILDISGYQREIEFTKEKRENPIFFPGDTCDEAITTYTIPKGFGVLSIPEDLKKDIGFSSVIREYKQEKDKITIREVAKQKRLELSKEDYPKVKEFFDKLPRATQQRIVLKKAKSWQQKLKEAWVRIRK